MLAFKRAADAEHFAILHPTLKEILVEIVNGIWREETGGDLVVVTELWRSRDETIARYRSAGLQPPEASVHEQVPCRGADLSVLAITAEGARKVVSRVNTRWRYEAAETHQVALFHDVAGVHLHLQVRPGDETRRRI